MAVFVMSLQRITSEVVGKVAPNRMDMIGSVLRVVQFNQEGRSLYALVMGVARLWAAGPRKVDFAAGFVELLHPAPRQLVG